VVYCVHASTPGRDVRKVCCHLVLKSGSGEEVHCKLVQDRDFLKERGSCENKKASGSVITKERKQNRCRD